MYDVEAADEGFHTKGYIFKKDEIYRIIVGSSNITSAALTSNREWNTKIVSTEQGEYVQEILNEFNELWNSKYTLDFDEFFDLYKERYKIIKKQREIARQEEIPSVEKYKLTPNNMQVGFIANLRKILDVGEERALLISATGTGKTYATSLILGRVSSALWRKLLYSFSVALYQAYTLTPESAKAAATSSCVDNGLLPVTVTLAPAFLRTSAK
jgi:predicted helicase